MSIALDLPVRHPRASREVVADYVALTKPRIIVLLEITAFFAMVMAAHGWPGSGLVLVTMIGGALAAGGANTINMWFDRDIDQAMTRTCSRPIPSGRIEPMHALLFGIALEVVSFTVLATFANLLAATLALSALLFYVLVYTMWLKRTSMQNIVIGGAAGAMPPLVGWAAVTGNISLSALFLFAIIFYWTPPHFWALALLIRRDYERARVPMLPVVKGDHETRTQIALYTVVMVAVTLLPVFTGTLSFVYLAGAAVLDGIFLAYAVRTWRDASARSAGRLFHYSLLYLALLFAVAALDSVVLAH
ncbi:MAG TPA: heme o synthase [Candidatus Dormibacteraeota bacterium]|nr:heme o synthase [Candidatus Dormibacteraeota bacterium]